MQENHFLKTLFNDRLPQQSALIEMIEKNNIEKALLITLQLISDMIVHCGEYLPNSSVNATPSSKRASSLYNDSDYTTTNDSNILPQ